MAPSKVSPALLGDSWITLASFIWHFSGAIANFILFIRCGAGISYTIILNISGHDEHAIDLSQIPLPPEHDDRIDELPRRNFHVWRKVTRQPMPDTSLHLNMIAPK